MSEKIRNSTTGQARIRFAGFDQLMPHRVQEILLVASMYDAFTLEEGGRLTELLLGEYRELNLSFPPFITRASTGEEALRLISTRPFDMVITMSRLGAMDASTLASRIKEEHKDLPVFSLSFNPRELQHLKERDRDSAIDRFFLWNGDVRLLLAIIKYCEDSLNVAHDSRYGDVRCILLIEDSVRFYSSYLPMLYTEVLEQTQSLMDEGLNISHRLLRLRARPKILLASTFEEAWSLYGLYKDQLLGVISDGRFPWKGNLRPDAGAEFIRRVKYVDPHTPAVLQSTNLEMAETAAAVGAGFIHKNSRKLLRELRTFMLDNFGFGDFVFRDQEGKELGRARDLRTLVDLLRTVPADSIFFHASHDHFSNWLRARTEFALADMLRPRKVTEFPDVEELRTYLIKSINTFRAESRQGIVADFSRRTFDLSSPFVRIGGGSLGGKGRGLAFMNSILHRYGVTHRFPDTVIHVPATAVIGTDVFDKFMAQSDLREFALQDHKDEEIVARFLAAKLPPDIYVDLETFLEQIRYPLAVRSSSLLEDSQFQPFAGVYSTFMLANSHTDLKIRLDQLCDAIKLVFASAYSNAAKSYVEATSNRIEEEKMAIIIQQMVGRRYEHYDYPHFSGVAHSSNFYPVGGLDPSDGVVAVAMGMGRTIVEGGKVLRFSPANPHVLPQFGNTSDWFKNSQREFLAVDVSDPDAYPVANEDFNLATLGLEDALRHGTLEHLGSIYSPDNDIIYPGIHRKGTPLVSFAHILNGDAFPLAEIIKLLLELGRRTMSAEVEIEFAVVLSDQPNHPHQFGFLQIRPLAAGYDAPDIPEDLLWSDEAVVATNVALGNGRHDEIRDIVYVPRDRFDRARTEEIAAEIGALNRELVGKATRYMLMGPGRWGSSDRWLGIPVRWDQISGAHVIVETDLDDFKITPSQGSHFFQNLTSFQVGYLTVNTTEGSSRLDWDWLDAQPGKYCGEFIRHIHLPAEVGVLIDGRSRRGVVLKPGTLEGAD
ncbi:histidine kinase [bacterium]|nr:histidine kinase [bacterium]